MSSKRWVPTVLAAISFVMCVACTIADVDGLRWFWIGCAMMTGADVMLDIERSRDRSAP